MSRYRDRYTSRFVGSLAGRRRRRGFALALAISVIGAGALAGLASADATLFTFRTLDDHRDLTFNQLLGINRSGVIAGYFGSGLKGHPNKGYTLTKPYGQGNYHNENFPHSAQTQVTGLNNNAVTVGFWVNKKGVNTGFYALHGGHFHSVQFPTKNNAKPRFNQLLGVNDSGIAVGFYNDSKGNSHGYQYNINKNKYHAFNLPGASSLTTAGINDLGDVAGFETNSAGNVVGFLKQNHGRLFTLAVPGATATSALGVNDGDEVVGFYTLGPATAPTATHGFIWAPGFGFQTIDDPNGIGNTTINGVNDRGQIVGFYVDTAGNTDGMLASPSH